MGSTNAYQGRELVDGRLKLHIGRADSGSAPAAAIPVATLRAPVGREPGRAALQAFSVPFGHVHVGQVQVEAVSRVQDVATLLGLVRPVERVQDETLACLAELVVLCRILD